MRRSHDGPRRPLAIAAVGLLIVLDVVLVWLAMQHGGAGSAGAQTPSAPASTVIGQAPSAEPPPASTETAEPTTPPTRATVRTLAMTSATTGWRAERGECAAGGATLETTTDGGATWVGVPLPGDATELAALSAVEAEPSRLAVTTFDPDCVPRYDRTFSGGASWQLDADTAIAPTRVGSTGSLIIGGVSFTVPCADPLEVVRPGSTVAVRCQDEVHVAPLTGSWSATGLGASLGVAALGDDLLVALDPAMVEGVDCDGLLVQRVSFSGGEAAQQCVSTGVGSGQVALSPLDGDLWVWSGDAVIRTPLTL